MLNLSISQVSGSEDTGLGQAGGVSKLRDVEIHI